MYLVPEQYTYLLKLTPEVHSNNSFDFRSYSFVFCYTKLPIFVSITNLKNNNNKSIYTRISPLQWWARLTRANTVFQSEAALKWRANWQPNGCVACASPAARKVEQLVEGSHFVTKSKALVSVMDVQQITKYMKLM